MKYKKMTTAITIFIPIISTACYFPEILSNDEVIASKVAKVVDEALHQIKDMATYTPYPTHTPIPTYTPMPIYTSLPSMQPFSAPSVYNMPYNYPYGPRR